MPVSGSQSEFHTYSNDTPSRNADKLYQAKVVLQVMQSHEQILLQEAAHNAIPNSSNAITLHTKP